MGVSKCRNLIRGVFPSQERMTWVRRERGKSDQGRILKFVFKIGETTAML